MNKPVPAANNVWFVHTTRLPTVPIDKVIEQLEVKKTARRNELEELELQWVSEDNSEVTGRKWELEWLDNMIDSVLAPCRDNDIEIPIPSEFTEAMDAYNRTWHSVHVVGRPYGEAMVRETMSVANAKQHQAIYVTAGRDRRRLEGHIEGQ